MRILQKRHYGEPKIKLPKDCNKANRIGTILWPPKGRACPVWKVDGKVYVHHRDYGSYFRPCSSLNGAIKDRKKFVYADTFSGICYAGHAIIEYTPEDFAPVPRRFGETRTPITVRLGTGLFDDPYDFGCINYNEQLLALLGLDIFGNQKRTGKGGAQ